MKPKIYLSEAIDINTFATLNNQKQYFIIGGTGSGKSKFIENKFSKMVMDENKRLLILVNRNMLKNQIENALIYRDTIEVMSYQKISQWSYVNILDTKSQTFLCCTSS